MIICRNTRLAVKTNQSLATRRKAYDKTDVEESERGKTEEVAGNRENKGETTKGKRHPCLLDLQSDDTLLTRAF